MDKSLQAVRNRAVQLRRKGKTFSEIRQKLNLSIPKSTLSYWLHHVATPPNYEPKIIRLNQEHLRRIRKLSSQARIAQREQELKKIRKNNRNLKSLARRNHIAKAVLAVLYVAEGTKRRNGAVVFGNSNPNLIRLFLELFRMCYTPHESKFRCTVQCRADQNTKQLEGFWSDVTGIPLTLFYKSRIDPRSIGKKSKKKDYKGVCRIDYLSASVYRDLVETGKVILEP